MGFRTILLAFDGSDTARAIVPTLTDLATRMGTEVIVFRCLEPRDDEAGDEDATRVVEALAAQLGHRGIQTRTHVGRGRPADAIVQAATELGAEAVAMSSHGRTGLARWALGSVAERVVRTSRVPVLLSRALPEEDRRAPEHIGHVLVPLEGGEASLQLVEPIASLIQSLEAQATVLHCVSDYRGKQAMEQGRDHLDRAEQAFAARGVNVDTQLCRGHAAATIADYGLLEASQQRPDLIVMATHARQGVPRMLLGSVTEKVLRASVVPVLVLPPSDASRQD